MGQPAYRVLEMQMALLAKIILDGPSVNEDSNKLAAKLKQFLKRRGEEVYHIAGFRYGIRKIKKPRNTK